MPSTHRLVTCLLTCAVFIPWPAWAQAASETPPGDASPHGGTVLRLRLGPTYLSTRVNKVPDLSAERYSGIGVAFDAEVGRPLTSAVTLCAELSGALVPSARADDSGTLDSGTPIADLATAGAGASLTYTTPWNFYVAANSAVMTFVTNYHGRNWSNFDLGLEIGFVAGGEWRVSSGWRLGLAGEARYAAMGGSPVISTMSQYALLFSATHD
jgi:hypothetical protein